MFLFFLWARDFFSLLGGRKDKDGNVKYLMIFFFLLLTC